MKKIGEKILSGAIAFIITFSNFGLLGNGLMEAIAEDTVKEEKQRKIQMSFAISKYVQYANEKGKGVILQEELNLGTEENENEHIPVLKNEVKVNVPLINQIAPNNIQILANSTENTDGKGKYETDFNESNWQYNEQDGTLTISYENKTQYTEYRKDSLDQFQIIYNYPETSYIGYENPVEVPVNISLTRTLKNDKEQVELKKELSSSVKLENQIGNIVTYNIQEMNEIYKGYMYVSKKNNLNKETLYKTKEIINISNINVIDDLDMKRETAYMAKESEQEIDAKEVEYRETKINSTAIDKIIGENGYLEIYSGGEDPLFSIEYQQEEDGSKKMVKVDKDGKAEYIQNNEITIQYPEGVNSIEIKTSRPIGCGDLELVNTKAIKGETDKSLKELENLEKILEKVETRIMSLAEKSVLANNVLNTQLANSILNNNTNINAEQTQTKEKILNTEQDIKEHSKKEIKLQEPSKTIEWNIDKKTWTTLEENKIKIEATLRDNDSKYALFNNPTLRIELPQEITKGKIIQKIEEKTSLLYANGLEIKNSSIKDNNIEIELSGEQKDYSNSEFGGTKVVIELSVSTKKDIPTFEMPIQLTCIEDNKVTSTNSETIKVQSKGSLLLINQIGFDEQIVTTYDSNPKEIQIDLKDNNIIGQAALILNDYPEEEITNVEIVEEIVSAEGIQSMYIKQIEQNSEDITVTYSQDGVNYLTQEEIKDFSNIKFYKIALKNSIKSKESKLLGFAYEIAKDIKNNTPITLKTTVNYKIKQTQYKEESTLKFIVKREEQKPDPTPTPDPEPEQPSEEEKILEKMNVEAKILVNDEEQPDNVQLKQGQFFKYRITVINNSEKDVQGLELTSTTDGTNFWGLIEKDTVLPDGGFTEATDYKEYSEYNNTKKTVVNIEKNNKYIWEFEVIAKQDSNMAKNLIKLKLGNYEKQGTEINSNLTEGNFNIKLINEYGEDLNIKSNSNLNMLAILKNISGKDIANSQVILNLPNELTIETEKIALFPQEEELFDNKKIKVEKNENVLKYKIEGSIQKDETIKIPIRMQTNDIDVGLEYKDIQLRAEAQVYSNNNFLTDNVSNIYNKRIYQQKTGIKAELNEKIDNKILKNGDKIIYEISVENPGKIDIESVGITGEFTRGININRAKLERENGQIEELKPYSNSDYFKGFSLKANEKVKINIELIINTNEVLSDAEKLDAKLTINTSLETALEYQNEYQFEKPTNPDNPDDPKDPDDPEDPVIPVDPSNPEEPVDPTTAKEITGIVWLDENKNGQRETQEKRMQNVKVIIYNKTTKRTKEVTTDEQGMYTVKVNPGTYIIMFEYDKKNYSPTEYQKDGVESGINSDAIASNVTIGGTKKKMAITNEINVNEEHINNIDLGLIKNAKFDLSLEKGITKVIVKNSKETRTINHNNAKLAKVDLTAKYINSTDIFVEYTFTIKNNGEVAGYVGKIQDNLPSGLAFSSELDKNWYKGADGMLYNSELSNTIINPGETKKVTLTLTKQMNEDNTGTIKNTGSLQEVKNVSAIEEESTENNTDSAQLIVSIKTGSPVMYISITLTCIAIIATGAYTINKKVLKD